MQVQALSVPLGDCKMSGGRYAKKRPEFIYFIGDDNQEWLSGPYVKPQSGRINRKFRLVEIFDDEKLNAKNEAIRKRNERSI